MKIKNILVPIDFSSCSKNALKVAIDLAKAFNAKIHMVNAVHVHTPHPDVVGGSLIESIVSDYEQQVKESFDKLEKEIIELQEVPHEADRFVAYLTDAIYSESKAKKIDLIVMGTREKHDKLDQIIGSRATDIISSSTVPVLVIPEKVEKFEINKIGFASDLSEIKNIKSLEPINLLAAQFNAEILAFTIVSDPAKLTGKDQKVIQDLSKRFGTNKNSVRAVHSERIIEGIKEFTRAHQLDLLAMVPRERSFIERLFKKSVTKDIAMAVDIPLLTFHE